MFPWLFQEAPRDLGMLALLLVGILVAVSLALRGSRGKPAASLGTDDCRRCGGTGRIRAGGGGDWPCLEDVHRPAT
ncbi:hypothetical protein GCM10023170_022880 [Phytohabitans houttuyneae]|uniref:Uncharacterized protein n=1 Tax=Phytohabitans houttuyneae TaxID=1076126 RepID=A0A6V8KPQ1_9ACTN|nr:hypothetical protein Phou_087680 [Phytohabitans houttuyneae]